jgi:hypothetical protein
VFSPTKLEIKPSYRIVALLWLPHWAALALLLGSSVPALAQWIGAFGILASGVYYSLSHGLLQVKHAIVHLHLDAKRLPGQCLLRQRDDQELLATIQGDSVVTASYVILRVCPEHSIRSRVLLLSRWNSSAEALRRLRVILRFQRKLPTDKPVEAD